MRVALDTKILVYAEGVNPGINHVRSVELVMSLPTDSTFIPLQVLGEFANVLRRKTSRTSSAIQDALDFWSSRFQVVETTLPVLTPARTCLPSTSFRPGTRLFCPPPNPQIAVSCSQKTYRTASPGRGSLSQIHLLQSATGFSKIYFKRRSCLVAMSLGRRNPAARLET